MNCLLFSGAPSVGKSESIYRLSQFLLSNGYLDILGLIPPTFADFSAVLEGNDQTGKLIRIVINTATDTPGIILGFKAFFDNHGKYDLMISSVRDHNFWPRSDFFNIMGISPLTHKIIELPLAKITRRGGSFAMALAWYETNIDDLSRHVVSLPPFSL